MTDWRVPMSNPLKTEHALDWGNTAQEIENQFQLGMIERDRYREALEVIANFPCVALTQDFKHAKMIAREALSPTK